MKIGEVLEKTGLTDRAVRLYIEHGLITPVTRSSYSGRKNVEFSDGDVEKLCRISLLRKADFSLPQIKRISDGGDDAAEALSEYLADKRERHAKDTGILASFDGFDGEVTLENIAGVLEKGGAEHLESKDLYITPEEKRERLLYTVGGIIIVSISSLALILPMVYFFINAMYPQINFGGVIVYLIIFIPVILGAIIGITLITRYRRGKVNICSVKKRTISIISVFVAAVLLYMGYYSVIITTMFPFVYSETKDIDNYLEIEENTLYANRDTISKLFPSFSPDTPNNNTKYHYFQNYEAFPSPTYFIYAEWELSEEDYNTEKARIDIVFPDAERKTKGEFVCVNVKEYDVYDGVSAFFAYCDSTRTVRYVLDHYYMYEQDYLEW